MIGTLGHRRWLCPTESITEQRFLRIEFVRLETRKGVCVRAYVCVYLLYVNFPNSANMVNTTMLFKVSYSTIVLYSRGW